MGLYGQIDIQFACFGRYCEDGGPSDKTTTWIALNTTYHFQ